MICLKPKINRGFMAVKLKLIKDFEGADLTTTLQKAAKYL